MSVEDMMRPMRDKIMSEIDGKPSLQEMVEMAYQFKHHMEISNLVAAIEDLIPIIKEQKEHLKFLQKDREFEKLLDQMDHVLARAESLR